MVFIWAIGFLMVLAWAFGSIFGFLSALPELIKALTPSKPRKIIRKKSRLP